MPAMNPAPTPPDRNALARVPKGAAPVPGFPAVNYKLPLVVTLATCLGLLIVLGAMGIITAAASYTQFALSSAGVAQASPILGAMCGVVSLVSLAGAVFLGVVAVRAIRDLSTPLYYARGDVRDKRTIGGRNVGNWLAVGVRYLGPDIEQASALTDIQRAAAPDRSQIVQSRGAIQPRAKPAPVVANPRSAYLPAERIYAEAAQAGALLDPGAPSSEGASRVVFRIDPASFAVLESGEEVLVAYSRYLQHIYFVSHLRGGEWESFQNKQLI